MSTTPEAPEAARPVLLAVDDEPSVARAVERDLRRRYGRDFRVLRAESGADALDAVRQSKLRGSSVALLLADQRMPSMNGVEFLEEAIRLAPEAKRVLLTAYADTQAAIDAINRVSLDHYLLKPWDPPEEQLYPVVDDLLDAWRAEAPAASDRSRSSATAGRASRTTPSDLLARNQVRTAGWTSSATTRAGACWRPPTATARCAGAVARRDGAARARPRAAGRAAPASAAGPSCASTTW